MRLGEEDDEESLFHPGCLCCSRCKDVIEGGDGIRRRGDDLFCTECYLAKFSKPCAVCDAPVGDLAIRDAFGGLMHPQHVAKLPSCHACRRPCLRERRTTGEDGRVTCAHCATSLVVETDEVREALRTVRAFFHRSAGVPVENVCASLKLAVFPLAKMRAVCKRLSGSTHSSRSIPLGCTLTERKGAGGPLRVVGIAVLETLPRALLLATLAHELCHAYLALVPKRTALSPRSEEGVAELWAYTYLLSHEDDLPDAKAHAFILDNDESEYGKAFRQALQLFQSCNCDLAATMDHVVATGGFGIRA